MLSDDSLDEKTVLDKMNCFLEKYWSKLKTENGFYFFLIKSNSYRINIYGSCLGRRLWKDLLQVVNAFADSADYYHNTIDIYKPFKGMKCKSLEELAIKIDLASSAMSK